MTETSPLTIAFATNGRYVPLALCCLTSLLLHATKRETLRIVLLGEGLSTTEVALFHQALGIFGCTPRQFTLIPTDAVKERLQGLPLHTLQGSLTPWLRLFLPELLPETSHVLYTDVDTLWLRDVQDFSPWMNIETSAAWVPDLCSQPLSEEFYRQSSPGSRPWWQQEGVSFDRMTYPNSGILILNLAKLRKEHFADRWQSFLKEHPNPPWFDQDLFACLLKDDFTQLPPWCNWISLSQGTLPESAVLHLAGRPHPWRVNGPKLFPTDDLLLFADFWKTVMVPLYGEVLKPYGWQDPLWGPWKYRLWPALQRRFPWLYTFVHRNLIKRAKSSPAKAEKLRVFWWLVNCHTFGTKIPRRTRHRLVHQWQQALQSLP